MTSKRLTAPYVIVLMIAVLMAAVAFSLAYAEEEPQGWDGPPPAGDLFPYHRGPSWGLHGMSRMADALDLSPEQRDEVREILEQVQPQMRELRQAMRDNMQRLHQLTPDDPQFSNTVAAASQQAGALVTRMIELGSQTRVEVHSILTPEQQARVPALKAEMKARRERSREHRGHDSRN